MQPKLLLPIVLFVWGLVGYQLLSGFSNNDTMTIQAQSNTSFTPRMIKPRDTFAISIVDRDPFLGTLASSTKPTKQPTKKRAYSQPTKDDPTVSFEGVIKKQGSSNTVFIVNINTYQHLLKKGQTINGVKLISGNAKRIRVGYNGKTQTITRN